MSPDIGAAGQLVGMLGLVLGDPGQQRLQPSDPGLRARTYRLQGLRQPRPDRLVDALEVDRGQLPDLRQCQAQPTESADYGDAPQGLLAEQAVVARAAAYGVDQAQILVLPQRLDRHPGPSSEGPDGHRRRRYRAVYRSSRVFGGHHPPLWHEETITNVGTAADTCGVLAQRIRPGRRWPASNDASASSPGRRRSSAAALLPFAAATDARVGGQRSGTLPQRSDGDLTCRAGASQSVRNSSTKARRPCRSVRKQNMCPPRNTCSCDRVMPV